MIIVGELINASRKSIAELIRAQDGSAIRAVAQDQAEHGANFIDVNAGVFEAREAEYLRWLVEQVQGAVPVPCAVDSPNPEALGAALDVHQGGALVNSISLERQRWDGVTSVLAGSPHQVVALCMDDSGIPETVDQRLTHADRLVNHLAKIGVAVEHIYLDPLLQAVSTRQSAAAEFLAAVTAIRERFPGVHCICGLSNVSFALPRRKLLNGVFAAMAVAHGLDAAILNPLDARLMTSVLVAETLAGQDAWCERYLEAHRADRLTA